MIWHSFQITLPRMLSVTLYKLFRAMHLIPNANTVHVKMIIRIAIESMQYSLKKAITISSNIKCSSAELRQSAF